MQEEINNLSNEKQNLISNDEKNHAKDELSSHSEEQNSLTAGTPNLRVYKSRWLMLLLFCLTTMLNGSTFVGLSAVVDIVAPFYKVSSVNIEWLSNMFMVIYIFVAMPSAYAMSKYGVKTIIIVASGCGAAAASLQYGGYKQRSYMFVVIGQIFAGVTYGNILQVPGRLSAIWFPPHERGISTSIGVFMNILGVAIGFVQPTHMIPDTKNFAKVENGLRMFFLGKMVFAVLVFALTAFCFKERPPTPSSHAQLEGSIEELGFKESLKMLVKDCNFIIMAQAYGIYYALYVGVCVVVSPLVLWKYESVRSDVSEQIGWMGFTCNISAVVSCYIIGIILARTSKYKAVAIFLNASSMLLWLAFIMILTRTKSFEALFAIYAVYGAVGIPYFASGVEQAVEMTYPVPEGTSSTVILFLGNLYGFGLILGFGYLLQQQYHMVTGYLILALYGLATLLLCIAKTELKRSKAENTLLNDVLTTDENNCKQVNYGSNNAKTRPYQV